MKDTESFYPQSQQDWREWLQENHDKKQSVWLICYKKQTGIPTLSWSDAVDEALCFGWIDSIRKTVDEDKFIQFYSRRKPNSTWSKVNKEKVQRFINDGMHESGLRKIEIAKQNGSWNILDTVDELLIPDDLAKAFQSFPGSLEYFSGLSKSVKKMMLYWLVSAKREETRQKRITEIASQAGEGKKPKQF